MAAGFNKFRYEVCTEEVFLKRSNSEEFCREVAAFLKFWYGAIALISSWVMLK